RAWYFQASAARPDASVFLKKSPPHLLISEALCAAFPHSYFILMVRNPFATVEGILRRKMWDLDRAEKTRLAAQHVLNCFRKQLENRKALGSRGLWLTYEALCKNPRSTAEDISLFLPELGDLTFEKKVPVKGLYDEPARDFNADQIARLSEADIRIISNVLSQDMPTLRDVGYSPAQP
ncbi:MAG: sulfotransferase, partial [Pseudomonadota bacterium]